MSQETTIKELQVLAAQFVQERNWRQFHGAKNISMNIAVEAAELMELFVWKSSKREIADVIQEHQQAIEHELADILFSLLLFADEYNIDLAQSFIQKLKHNAQKYPVEKCKGKNKKYSEL